MYQIIPLVFIAYFLSSCKPIYYESDSFCVLVPGSSVITVSLSEADNLNTEMGTMEESMTEPDISEIDTTSLK